MDALENRTSFSHIETRNRNSRSFNIRITLSLYPLSYPFHFCINTIVFYDVATPCTSAEGRQHYAEKRVQLVPPELIYQSIRCHEPAVPEEAYLEPPKWATRCFRASSPGPYFIWQLLVAASCRLAYRTTVGHSANRPPARWKETTDSCQIKYGCYIKTVCPTIDTVHCPLFLSFSPLSLYTVKPALNRPCIRRNLS